MLDNSIAEINQHFSNANVLKSRKKSVYASARSAEPTGF